MAVTAVSEPVGTLEVALAHATRLLEVDPALAAEQATEILKAAPQHPPTLLLLATAYRKCGDLDAALQILETLEHTQPNWAAAHFQRGVALGRAGRGDAAIQALRRTLALKPDHTDAWRVLADHLMAIGDTDAADAAYARQIQCSTRDPRLLEAATALVENNIPKAEALLRAHLMQAPTDVAAIRMLAEVAVRVGRKEDAEKLLARCLELAPSFTAARSQYALVLYRLNKAAEALVEIERLLAIDPHSPSYRNLHAVVLSRIGEYERSSEIYKKLLEEYPVNSKVWLSYGHVLKTAGGQDECIHAYRKSIELDPAFGEAYWSLANLKTFRFTETDVAAMRVQLERPELNVENRLHFHFAMGKALEDVAVYAGSFEHYAKGNALHRTRIKYDADQITARRKKLMGDFTREFFEKRSGFGCQARDPIFIVGLPRAGSTLLEQILSSHSAVEGTMELPEIINMAKELRERTGNDDVQVYSDVLAAMGADEARQLGEQYIANTRINRKTDAPFFIDKMPNNFIHIGLIQLALPNAKIIDARRHPLGCCFSNFKQHYARGQNFSYSLEDIGRFYRDYVAMMAHFDAVLPGRIHRVFYETMVDDTETEIRKLLDYCELPFEPGCLKFFENDRPVRTASSEQVRQPIYRDGVEQWRHFEEWLDPLKIALGPVLEAYPSVPGL